MTKEEAFAFHGSSLFRPPQIIISHAPFPPPPPIGSDSKSFKFFVAFSSKFLSPFLVSIVHGRRWLAFLPKSVLVSGKTFFGKQATWPSLFGGGSSGKRPFPFQPVGHIISIATTESASNKAYQYIIVLFAIKIS
jgi:hypothetical protein